MRFQLYIDEDRIEAAFVLTLRRSGFDVLTCGEANMRGAQDERQLEFASSQGRVLYTANVRDFAPMHWQWLGQDLRHSGIIVCNDQHWSVGEQLRRIVAVADLNTAEQMVNNLEHLSHFATVFDG